MSQEQSATQQRNSDAADTSGADRLPGCSSRTEQDDSVPSFQRLWKQAKNTTTAYLNWWDTADTTTRFADMTDRERLEQAAELEHTTPMKDLRQHDREHRGVTEFYDDIPTPEQNEYTTLLPRQEEMERRTDKALTDIAGRSPGDILASRKQREQLAEYYHSAAKAGIQATPLGGGVAAGVGMYMAASSAGAPVLAVYLYMLGSLAVTYLIGDGLSGPLSTLKQEHEQELDGGVDRRRFKVFDRDYDGLSELFDAATYLGVAANDDEVYLTGDADAVRDAIEMPIEVSDSRAHCAVSLEALDNLSDYEEGYMAKVSVSLLRKDEYHQTDTEDLFHAAVIGDEALQDAYENLEDDPRERFLHR